MPPDPELGFYVNDPDPDPYVNEACPEHCGTQHVVQSEGEWECPETGSRYAWCDLCGSQTALARWSNAQRISYRSDNNWVQICDTGDHDLLFCEDCGLYFDSYDGDWQGDYDDTWICHGCRREACRPRTPPTCRSCNTKHVNFDLIAEEYLCRCQLANVLNTHPDRPYKVVGEAK